jgi:DNA-binding CsgD family transcriptional regulator
VPGVAAEPVKLVGRDNELARLRTLVVDPSKGGAQVLVVLGDAGMGKTVLVAEAAAHAKSKGIRVLSTAGSESEGNLAFAGLHQLLLPVLDRVGSLAERQAQALRGALALDADPVAPDPLLTGTAVLTLLSDLSDERPLLVVVEDAHWLDRSSRDLLAFVGRRLDAERLMLLFSARPGGTPTGFEHDFPEMLLGPLSERNAGRLLDELPSPPRGRVRDQVLAQAAGNPLALIELSRVIAGDPSAGRGWVAEPLPLNDRLMAVMAAEFGTLPEPTRAALLLAAVADSSDLTLAQLPGLTPDAFAPAEHVGLINLGRSGPRFSHPLVRSAIYHAVPFTERASAHLRIAGALVGEPDRQAWHLAAATLNPDERIAAQLEATAVQAQRRGGIAAAAHALERSAELSISASDQARRLLSAAGLAVPTGQVDWVQDLATRVLSSTDDQALCLTAKLQIGWALTWSNQHTAALDALTSVAAEASVVLPDIAWDAAGWAGTVAYQAGTEVGRQKSLRTLELLEQRLPLTSSGEGGLGHADVQRVWIRACTDPFGKRAEVIPYLRRIANGLDAIAGGPLDDLSKVGAAAWLLDETDLAVTVLRKAVSRLRAPGVRGTSVAALSALGWACFDGGRWDEALATAGENSDLAAAYQMEIVAASADLTTASVLVMRGDADLARTLLDRAVASVDVAESRAVDARARHVAGVAALAGANAAAAYAQLRPLFDVDGGPLHHHVSYLAIADLAAAGIRADRRLETQTLVGRALAELPQAPGPRVSQIAARARGLLAGSAGAESIFSDALSDPAGDQWPFERAQLQLDYGEWLRRRRRINDAKTPLSAALETFRRLQALPWIRRAEAELRASGVALSAGPTTSDALAGLSPQQRQIVILASRGMTNAQIGDQLFLSPRTVASHLYRCFPQLGVSTRNQLHDLIDHGTE